MRLQDTFPFDVTKLDPEDCPVCGLRCTMVVGNLAEENASNERGRADAGGGEIRGEVGEARLLLL